MQRKIVSTSFATISLGKELFVDCFFLAATNEIAYVTKKKGNMNIAAPRMQCDVFNKRCIIKFVICERINFNLIESIFCAGLLRRRMPD